MYYLLKIIYTHNTHVHTHTHIFTYGTNMLELLHLGVRESKEFRPLLHADGSLDPEVHSNVLDMKKTKRV